MRNGPADRRRPVVGVGALILRPDGRILIGHRIKAGEEPTWCLPGGLLEPGESFEEAALRETEEEAGVTEVHQPRVFAIALDTGADSVRLTVCVVAHANVADCEPDTPEPDVFDCWVWADPDRPPQPLFPATAALLDVWHGRPAGQGWEFYPAG